jgi:hypothetical protein
MLGHAFQVPRANSGPLLTPKQRFRQLEPSWFVRGQTTSLLASVSEKELVREERGGMASCMYPREGLAG